MYYNKSRGEPRTTNLYGIKNCWNRHANDSEEAFAEGYLSSGEWEESIKLPHNIIYLHVYWQEFFLIANSYLQLAEF